VNFTPDNGSKDTAVGLNPEVLTKRNFFLELFSGELLKQSPSPEILSTMQLKAQTLLDGKQYDELEDLVSDVKVQFPNFSDVIKSELSEYTRLIKDMKIVNEPRRKEAAKFHSIIDALLEKIDRKEMFQTISIPQELSWADCKNLMQQLVEHLVDNEDSELFPFIISNNFCEIGSVNSRLYPTKKDISMMAVAETVDGRTVVAFPFVDKLDMRALPSIRYMHFGMWFSRFTSDSQQEYILLSKEPLKMQHGSISGMLITFRDVERIGSSAKIPTNIPLIFVTEQKEDVKEIGEAEVRNITLTWRHEDLAKCIFGLYRHPEWFEKFILAWLFSGKVNDYPLNIGWFSQAGTGKSYVLDTIQAQFHERKGIFGTGTLKGLVPNFGDSLPDEGYICKCDRVALIDEFFSIVRRAKQTGDIDSGTDMLTNILEHRSRPVQSGRGASSYIEVHPRAKTAFISNTRNFHGLENMVEISHSLNNPFLSRILWYCQTKQHIAFIDENRSKVKNLVQNDADKGIPKQSAEFMSIYDFFNSVTLKLDFERTAKIIEKHRPIIPEDLYEVYRRYDHHLECLVDGIAKYRFITEVKETLVVEDADYEEAEIIFSTIIHSWLDTVNIEDITTIKARVNFLKPELRKVYDIVDRNPGITKTGFGGIPELENKIRELEHVGLVKALPDERDILIRKFYPFWHMYVQG